jgi:hypothetical protein
MFTGHMPGCCLRDIAVLYIQHPAGVHEALCTEQNLRNAYRPFTVLYMGGVYEALYIVQQLSDWLLLDIST